MDEQDGLTGQPAEPVQVSGAEVAASLAPQGAPDAGTGNPPPERIRESPEYQELQRQNRALARENGSLRSESERLRLAEQARAQAAEDERVRQLQQQMTAALGERAPEFAEFAQLLQTDPVAAAQRFGQLGVVQSAPVPPQAPQVGEPTATEGDEPVGEQTQMTPRVPMPSSRSVGSVPLGQQPTQQQAQEMRLEQLGKEYEDVVRQNQNLQTRTRVTQRVRDRAFGAFLRRGYVAQGIDPELELPQR